MNKRESPRVREASPGTRALYESLRISFSGKSNIKQKQEMSQETDKDSNKRVAEEKLKKFDFSKLLFTKKDELHKKRRINQVFLTLCELAEIDPLETIRKYKTNQEEAQPIEKQEYINNIDKYRDALTQKSQNEENKQDKDDERKSNIEPQDTLFLETSQFLNPSLVENFMKSSVPSPLMEEKCIDTQQHLVVQNPNYVNNIEKYLVKVIPQNGYDESNLNKEELGLKTNKDLEKPDQEVTSGNEIKNTFPEKLISTSNESKRNEENKEKQEITKRIEQAKKELASFDTRQLVRRKDGGLDRRYNINKDYMELEERCHESYYTRQPFKPIEMKANLLGSPADSATSNVRNPEIAKKIEEAMNELAKFDTRQLVRRKDGGLDRRYNLNKFYLELEARCHENYYYDQNTSLVEKIQINTNNYLNTPKETFPSFGQVEKANLNLIEDGEIKTDRKIGPVLNNIFPAFNSIMKGSDNSNDRVDLNIHMKKQEIILKIEHAKRKLAEFDTGQLVRRKDGGLDRRYKTNKLYIELEAQCHEIYYV